MMDVQLEDCIPVSSTSSCTVCRDFQPVQFDPNANFIERLLNKYDVEVEKLDDGCHRCSLLKAVLKRTESLVEAEYQGVGGRCENVWVSPQPDEKVSVRYAWRREFDGVNRVQGRQLSIRPASQAEIDTSKKALGLSSLHWSPKSKETVEFLDKMLQDCGSGADKHQYCFHLQDSILPTRVVQIGHKEGSLRLHEPQLGETGTYIALSHCWGPPDRQPIRTIKQTISQMRTSIPWSILSAVFQDAIWVCDKLEVDYIWIDSLCIVQDDARDWEIESAKMAAYYSQAYLTIAAESSPDGTVPFLEEPTERWKPMIYSTVDQAGRPLTSVIREHYSLGAHMLEPKNYSTQASSLLPARAWTMQEAILSQRIVRFTPSDVIWECNSTTVSLDIHRDMLADESSITHNLRPALFGLHHSPGTEEERQVLATTLWSLLVKQYTLRGVTFDSDRLPAFSGIASIFRPFLKGKYLAGIWESHLPYGLCWKRTWQLDFETSHLALDERVALTWSWASLPARISVDYPQDMASYQELVPSFRPTILEAHCEASPDAPFGRVRNGCIVLEAPLFEVTLTYIGPSLKQPNTSKYRVLFGSEFGGIEISEPEFIVDCLLAVEDGNAVRATRDYQVEYRQDPSSFEARAWVLWLSGVKREKMSGLLLGLDSNSGEYQRLGYVAGNNLRDDTFPSEPDRISIKIV